MTKPELRRRRAEKKKEFDRQHAQAIDALLQNIETLINELGIKEGHA
jgi:hypothetical protein